MMLTYHSAQAIFTDVLSMKREAAKTVLEMLNFEQKQRRMDIAQEMSTTFNEYPDLLKKKVITGDEWMYVYGIQTQAQSFHKRKIQTGIVGVTKKRLSKVFRRQD